MASLFAPNHYRAEARILPVDSKAGSAGLGGLAAAAAAFGVNVPGADGSDSNFTDILDSRWLKERLLGSVFEFKERKWRFGHEEFRKQTLFDYLKAKNMDQAIRALGPMRGSSKDQKSKVITLFADSSSPDLSQQLAQRSLKLLEEFIQQKGHTRGGAKASFAEARLKEARGAQSVAEDAFRQFLEKNRNYLSSTDPSTRLLGARLEAELKLRQQLVMTLALNLEQSLIEEKNDIPILNVLDPPNLPVEKSGPKRAFWVIGTFFMVTGFSWAWLSRRWIGNRLMDFSIPEEAKTDQPRGNE